MLVIQILILALLVVAVPTAVGTLFTTGDKGIAKIPFAWISGQILLWAGFQCICVPMILREKSYLLVQQGFLIMMGVLLLLEGIVWIVNHRRTEAKLRAVKEPEEKKKSEYILWAVFAVLLVLQLILAGVLAYEEGDDAFYVAISTVTESSNTMYSMLPYTGWPTELDARHGLAPFPIWITFLARISGMPAVTVAQVALPMVLIVMTYAIYYLIGKGLFSKRKDVLPLFMILVAVLILFGGYSTYSAENFLLVRTSQGKAVLANIIIPFLLYLSWRMLEKIHKGEKVGTRHWLLFALTMIAGCLCSTLGAVITCMLLGVVGLCTVVSYRRWKILFPMFASCIIPMVFAVLYLVLE